jgi:NCS1 family nucleobase:cation symporter-1
MSGHSNASPAVAIPGADPRLYNHDLAPVAPEGRTGGVFSIVDQVPHPQAAIWGYSKGNREQG